MDSKKLIEEGKSILGIEFGSTRIKAVVIDEAGNVLATGGHGWENRFENSVWTYRLSDADMDGKTALKTAYGLSPKKISGKDLRIAIRIWFRISRQNTMLM